MTKTKDQLTTDLLTSDSYLLFLVFQFLSKGVGDKDGICGTCKKKFIDCPGHFGYF